MFDFLKKKTIAVLAPMEGELMPLSAVPDPAFAQEILGKGVAIKPEKGRVVSPVSGTVSQVFETGHAVSLTSAQGVEILIHIGMDTVALKGQGFTTVAKDGQHVESGDVLIEFDIEKITAAGYSIITPIIICNTDNYKTFHVKAPQYVQEGVEIITLEP